MIITDFRYEQYSGGGGAGAVLLAMRGAQRGSGSAGNPLVPALKDFAVTIIWGSSP